MMADTGRIEVSIVVPVYRNRETLAPLCERLSASLADAGIDRREIILVDDASPDDAWSEIRALAKRRSEVHGIRLGQNAGQHLAVLTGMCVAQGAIVVAMDGDLQDLPEAVPRLIAALNGSDVVFAGRRGVYQGWGATLTSLVYRHAILRHIGLPVGAGMFFAMSRTTRDRILAYPFHKGSVIGLIGAGSVAVSAPHARDKRAVGRSSYTFRSRLRAARRVVTSWRLAQRTLSGRLGGAAPSFRTVLPGAIAEQI
jgi:glycosyltransferase involved in cell wall biosynthesis